MFCGRAFSSATGVRRSTFRSEGRKESTTTIAIYQTNETLPNNVIHSRKSHDDRGMCLQVVWQGAWTFAPDRTLLPNGVGDRFLDRSSWT